MEGWREIEDFYQRYKGVVQVRMALWDFFSSPLRRMNWGRMLTILELMDEEDLRGKKVVDLCCGSGLLSYLFSKHGCMVRGVDVDEEMIEVGRLLIDEFKAENVSFISKDVMELELPPGSQDIILLAYGLHHLKDKELILRRIKVWLKGGGLLIINEENRSSPLFRFKHFLRFKVWGDKIWESHLTYYELKDKLRARGFKVVEERSLDYLPKVPISHAWSVILKAASLP